MLEKAPRKKAKNKARKKIITTMGMVTITSMSKTKSILVLTSTPTRAEPEKIGNSR